MQKFRHSFIVESPIERVWHLYTDIKHLEMITPKGIELKIICTTDQNITQGQEIWVSGKIFGKMRRRIKWHSKITFLKPHEYIDEMLSGPFKRWRHLHRFHSIEGKHTEIIDEVEVELPYGIIGKLFERYTCKQLQNIFEYRKIATIKALEQ
ncbi:MAG: SRPBCC family protein [Thermoproteota archaeon]|nr:SRPBCC family protein [Thermoproteota archaeon]